MSAVQQYLLSVNSDSERATNVVKETAAALETKKTTLIEVVQSLGDYINDEDTTNRDRAMGYLSRVAGALPGKFLSKQQTEVLCQFFADRIEDGGAIEGLRSLQDKQRFSRDMAVMTFRALIEHFQDLQVRPQARRLQVLEILSDLLLNWRNALKDLGKETIVGITDIVANEKDPRNLMVVFSILRVIIVECEISDHAESLFDAVFCYFPITFRPPPNDPYGITAQDLKDRLRECISSSSCFAPFAFPQLLEKLDSTSSAVKIDVLQTISACAQNYGLQTMSNFSVTLWDSLKYEILNVQEEQSAEHALQALQSIASRLGRDLTTTDPKTQLATYIRPITKECNQQLHEPEHKQAKPAGQILATVGRASPIAFYLTMRSSFPVLSTIYQAADTIPKQRALLEVLIQLLDSAIAVYGTAATPAPDTNIENPLGPFKDRVFELTSQALMSTAIDEISFRIVALKALLRLSLLRQYLNKNEVGMVVQYLNEITLSEDHMGRDALKKDAIQALVEISRFYPDLIMNITFPALLARLPDHVPAGKYDYLITLEALAQLSVDKFVAETLVRRLLNRLDVVLSAGGAPAYPRAILATIHFILAHRGLLTNNNSQVYLEKIVVDLSRRVSSSSIGRTGKTALNEDKTMETLARLTTLIIRHLDEHKRKSLALQCYSLFAEDLSFVPVPFQYQASEDQMSTMILSTAIMAGVSSQDLPQFVESEGDSALKLLDELIRLTISTQSAPINLSILRQLGLLISKFLPSSSLQQPKNILQNLIAGLSREESPSGNGVRTIFWMAKALVLQMQGLEELLESLLALLSNPCGAEVAQGFALLISPDEVFAKENGANIRLLAKQKIFHICVPRLEEGFRSAGSTLRANYLVALSGILKHVPTSVLMPESQTLLPMLLQSLELPHPDVKAATIESLTTISQEDAAAVEGHLDSLVTRLLRSAVDPALSGPAVRHNSLRCLNALPGKVKDSALLPLRNRVVRTLSNALDDPKRDIRKEAVECRAAWLGMDEPESD